MAKSRKSTGVIPFPRNRIVREVRESGRVQAGTVERFSPEREARHDRIAELLAERAKQHIREWQEAEGMPDEETLLVRRLEALSLRPEGLSHIVMCRLRALLEPQDEVSRLVMRMEWAIDEAGGIETADKRRLLGAMEAYRRRHDTGKDNPHG